MPAAAPTARPGREAAIAVSTSRVTAPVTANTTTLTMSSTKKADVIVARKRSGVKCRACSTNTSPTAAAVAMARSKRFTRAVRRSGGGGGADAL